MLKSEMTCEKCIKREGLFCRCNPEAAPIWEDEKERAEIPHWCAQGEWHELDILFKNKLVLYWGDWELDMKTMEPKV